MRGFATLAVFVVSIASGVMAGRAKADEPQPTSDVATLAQKCRQSVLIIQATGPTAGQSSQGSGFVIRPDGLVATNYHVVAGAMMMTAALENGASFQVEGLAAFDAKRDLAILRLKARNLTALPLGDSDKAVVGESVVAIGSPQGLEYTVSVGVVSGTRDLHGIGSVIQTTAPISQGSSGGPLLNMRGEVVGLTSMTQVGGQNLNFAVPANDLARLLETVQQSTGQLVSDRLGMLPDQEAHEVAKVPNRTPALWIPSYSHFALLDTVKATDVNHREWQRVEGAPTTDQYAVRATGVLEFCPTDRGKDLDITYKYRPERLAVWVANDNTGEAGAWLAELFRRLGFEVVASDEVASAVSRSTFKPESASPDAFRQFARLLNSSKLAVANVTWTDPVVEAHLRIFDLVSGSELYANQTLGVEYRGRKRRNWAVGNAFQSLIKGFYPGLR